MEIKKLNMLRGLAAFIVLIGHFSDATNWLDNVLGGRAGQYGVMLFFMISGFLMSYLYITKQACRQTITQYAFARFGRVVPLFFLVVILSYVFRVNGVEGLFDISNAKYLVSHLIFIDGESILWTVAPEIQFYIIFVGLWLLTSWKEEFLYVLIAATLVLIFLTNFPRPSGEIYGFKYDFHLFRSIPYFLVGLILGKHYTSLNISSSLKTGWFVLTLLLIPLMYPEFSPVESQARYRMWLDFGPLLVMSVVFFSIVFLVPKNNIILSNKLGDFIGKISYSLYLLHMPILWQVNKLEFNVEVKLILFILVSVITSYFSYIFIERPSAKLIRGLAANK